VDGGTLAAAARALRVTPSSISKQLAKLERRLGVRLLQRTTRSLRVTAAGARYRAHAQRVMSALAEAEADVQSEETALAGALRVSAPTLLGQEAIAPIAARFLRENAGVELDLELTDRFVDLVSEPIDLAIRVASRLPESGLSARRLGLLSWHFVASPAYIKQRGAPRRPEDLGHHACLDLAHGTDRGRWRMAYGGAEVEVDVRGPLVSSSLVALHRSALAGLGVAQLPSYLVREDLERRRLVQVLPSAGTARRTVFAVQPSRSFAPPRVRAFTDFLAAELPAVVAEPSRR
jgi:DNA-binding transcriptional LysR family regulator